MPVSGPKVLNVRGKCEAGLDGDDLRPAAEALRAGRLVAFPTETVYGLGADALNPEAVRRIFSAKERPHGHPLIVHVPDVQEARQLAEKWPEVATRLAEAFWPGPMTLIVPREARVPEAVTGGLATVGIRVPDHPVALALLREARRPVAAPSANIHQRISPTRAEHVIEGLGDRVDVVVDGGPTEVGVESTVIRVGEQGVEILRPGMISREAIAKVVDDVVYGGEQPNDARESRPSPGMADKHYAPQGRVRLARRKKMAEVIRGEEAPERAGLVVFGELPERIDESDLCLVEVLPEEPAECARHLYAVLHRLDDAGCDEIWFEKPPASEDWEAIRDRIRRAAA
jgi:L-threonylcarbamoyladenylate synthase